MCGWIAVISPKRTALSYKIIDTLNICSAWACCLVQRGRSKQTVVVAVMVPGGFLKGLK